jgi:phospholipid/cholesterol/gamma-HCH transport system permease protein
MGMAVTRHEHGLGTVDSQIDGDHWRIVLGGQWTVAAATGIDRALKSLPSASQHRVAIDMARVSALDTAGAWLVWRTIAALKDQGIEAELISSNPTHTSLIDTVSRNAVP